MSKSVFPHFVPIRLYWPLWGGVRRWGGSSAGRADRRTIAAFPRHNAAKPSSRMIFLNDSNTVRVSVLFIDLPDEAESYTTYKPLSEDVVNSLEPYFLAFRPCLYRPDHYEGRVISGKMFTLSNRLMFQIFRLMHSTVCFMYPD